MKARQRRAIRCKSQDISGSICNEKTLAPEIETGIVIAKKLSLLFDGSVSGMALKKFSVFMWTGQFGRIEKALDEWLCSGRHLPWLWMIITK
jgi:hypothetical protein